MEMGLATKSKILYNDNTSVAWKVILGSIIITLLLHMGADP